MNITSRQKARRLTRLRLRGVRHDRFRLELTRRVVDGFLARVERYIKEGEE